MGLTDEGGRIANPFSRVVLEFKVDDQGRQELKSELPPAVVTMLLAEMTIKSVYNYIDRQLEEIKNPTGKLIERP